MTSVFQSNPIRNPILVGVDTNNKMYESRDSIVIVINCLRYATGSMASLDQTRGRMLEGWIQTNAYFPIYVLWENHAGKWDVVGFFYVVHFVACNFHALFVGWRVMFG